MESRLPVGSPRMGVGAAVGRGAERLMARKRILRTHWIIPRGHCDEIQICRRVPQPEMCTRRAGLRIPYSRASKELSEAMAMRRRVKNVVFDEPPGTYRLVVPCSGNALLPILTAFALPMKECLAVERHRRDRPYGNVRRFTYVEDDIRSPGIASMIDDTTILTSVHLCKNLAHRVVDLFLGTPAAHLILMPCCCGSVRVSPIRSAIGWEGTPRGASHFPAGSGGSGV